MLGWRSWAAARASRKNFSCSSAVMPPARGILMATVRSSSLSRAFHTLPKPPTPSRSISSKRPSFVSDGAMRVALLWSTRLKWLPQALQVRSVSGVSTATSVGAWQFGQRTSRRPRPVSDASRTSSSGSGARNWVDRSALSCAARSFLTSASTTISPSAVESKNASRSAGGSSIARAKRSSIRSCCGSGVIEEMKSRSLRPLLISRGRLIRVYYRARPPPFSSISARCASVLRLQ